MLAWTDRTGLIVQRRHDSHALEWRAESDHPVEQRRVRWKIDSSRCSGCSLDQWTVNRLTLNAGLRFDYHNASVPAQHVPARRFVPAFDFEEIKDVPNWKDLSPRLGCPVPNGS